MTRDLTMTQFKAALRRNGMRYIARHYDCCAGITPVVKIGRCQFAGIPYKVVDQQIVQLPRREILAYFMRREIVQPVRIKRLLAKNNGGK